jgi:hypothetical protein
MHHLRKLVIVGATIFVLALGVFALVKSPVPQSGDVIIIKGGSLEIQCGSNHGNDCLGVHDATGKYKHKKTNGKIEQIVVKDSSGTILKSFDRKTDFADGKPSIEITYR